jgi:KaiC/GvpD/RAD55 family RecA-like ATPase
MDMLEDAQKSFVEGDYVKTRSLAASIWRALNIENAINADHDWRKHLKDYESKGTVIRMPPEWGFRRIKMGEKEVNKEVELERGLCYTIGARPGTGKTSVAINLAYYYAKRKAEHGYKVLFLTNEMKPGQLWVKMRQVDLVITKSMRRPFMLVKNYVRYPKRFESEYTALCTMCAEMEKSFAMMSIRRMGADDVVMLMSEAKNIFGAYPDIVVVDYLQRIPRLNAAKDFRESTIRTYQALSEAALDMDAVIFVLSQMNKEGGFKESEIAEEEAGIAWEISRPEGQDGSRMPFIDWKIKKSRISAYTNVRVPFDEVSGTVLDEVL